MTELKTKVLELLNYPAEFIKKTNLLYRYTVYTPQEEMKQIILEDPESRINILRHIFGIDKYKKIRENLIILTAKLREESRILQVEIRDLDENKNKFDSLKEFVKLLNNKINEQQQTLIEKINQRKRIEEDKIKKAEIQKEIESKRKQEQRRKELERIRKEGEGKKQIILEKKVKEDEIRKKQREKNRKLEKIKDNHLPVTK